MIKESEERLLSVLPSQKELKSLPTKVFTSMPKKVKSK